METSTGKRYWTSKKLLLNAVRFVLLPLIAYGIYVFNRDQGVVSNGWGLYVGTVDSIRYFGDDENYPDRYNTTKVLLTDGRGLTLCGDETSDLVHGAAYRLDLKVVQREHRNYLYTCQKVLSADAISNAVEIAQASGTIQSVDYNSYAGYRVVLKLSNSTGGSATDLVLCNDLELDRQSDTASILGGMRGSNATVFYNRAAYSSRFSCYPPIGIYRTGSNAVIATLNAPIFLSDWRVQLPGLVPHSEPLQSDNVAPAPTEPTTSPGTASQSNAPVASANTDVTTTPQPDPSPSQIKTDAYLVQVAAVSRQEDAEILVSILRKKQYPVFAASDRDDHLYHVQVGPFSDQLEADAERKRLIADGYNATVASPK